TLHGVADLLQPFDYRSLSDGFAHLRHQNISSHSSSPIHYISFSRNVDQGSSLTDHQSLSGGRLNARRHSMNRFSRLHHRFRQSRMRMHYMTKFFRRGLQPHRHAGFGQQVCSVWADDMDAEHLVVFGVGDDFDEAFSLAQDHRLAQSREREFADLDLVASLFSLRFAQADAADLRFAVSAIRN